MIEAKARDWTDESRTPQPIQERRLGDKALNIIQKASRQSERFERFLRDYPTTHRFETTRGVTNVVDASQIESYLRVNVVLEPLGTTHSHPWELRQAGLLDANLSLVPTFTAFEFKMVMEMLPSVAVRIRYLRWRLWFEEHVRYRGEELDVLDYFLDGGYGWPIPTDVGTLDLSGRGRWLARYQARDRAKPPPAAPQLRIATRWAQILNQLERSRPPNWLDVADALLAVSPTDQEAKAAALRQAEARARKRAGSHSKRRVANSVISVTGSYGDVYAHIVLLVLPDPPKVSTRQLCREVAAQYFTRPECAKVVVFTSDLTGGSPYEHVLYVSAAEHAEYQKRVRWREGYRAR